MKRDYLALALWTWAVAGVLQLASGAVVQGQCLSEGFEGLPPAPQGTYLFRQPLYSGSTKTMLDPSINASTPSQFTAHSGSFSLRVRWKFSGANTASYPWLRLTTHSNYPGHYLPNPAIANNMAVSFWIYVPDFTPDFYVTAGFREVDNWAPCGENGEFAGSIEWVGAAGVLQGESPARAPQGVLVDVKNTWINLTFSLPCDLALNFFQGNGKIDGLNNVFEHLAFTPVNPASLGPYTIYLDDFEFREVPLPEIICPQDQLVVGTCDGTAYWDTAFSPNGCSQAVLSSSRNPGDFVGFGLTTVHSTVTDGIGRTAACSFNLEVLAPIPTVEFLPPLSSSDVNYFQVGQTIPIKVRIFDCLGLGITQRITLTVNAVGVEADGQTPFHKVDSFAHGLGDGNVMRLNRGQFSYNLNTSGFLPGTLRNGRYYRLGVGVWDDRTGLLLGSNEVVLESR